MKTISLKKAAVINAVSQYSNIILYIGFNIVLARLLTPEEFGIFAVVSIFTTFFSKIYDGGLGSFYLSSPDKDTIFFVFLPKILLLFYFWCFYYWGSPFPFCIKIPNIFLFVQFLLYQFCLIHLM